MAHGWRSAKECRSRVRTWSLVLFPLSPFFWAVFPESLQSTSYTCLHRTSYKHSKTEAVSIVRQRYTGSRYTLVARWANYHHITQYQPQGVGPKRSLDSGTPATGTKGDGGRRICDWDWWLMSGAPQKCVGPGFKPGRCSFFPCHNFSEQCFQNQYRALATPAYTELPTMLLKSVLEQVSWNWFHRNRFRSAIKWWTAKYGAIMRHKIYWIFGEKEKFSGSFRGCPNWSTSCRAGLYLNYRSVCTSEWWHNAGQR